MIAKGERGGSESGCADVSSISKPLPESMTDPPRNAGNKQNLRKKKDMLLTAAHCVRAGSYSARIGGDRVNGGSSISISEGYKHPSYSSFDSGSQWDIAVLKLASPVTIFTGGLFNLFANGGDIPLANLNADDAFPRVGSQAVALGWGDTDPDMSNQVLAYQLQEAALDVISNERCEDSRMGQYSYEGLVDESMICTYTLDQDACQVRKSGRGPANLRSSAATSMRSERENCQ